MDYISVKEWAELHGVSERTAIKEIKGVNVFKVIRV